MCPAWGGLSAILNKSNFRAWVFLRYIHFKTSISAPLKFQKTSEGITSKSEEKGRAVGIFHSWWRKGNESWGVHDFSTGFPAWKWQATSSWDCRQGRYSRRESLNFSLTEKARSSSDFLRSYNWGLESYFKTGRRAVRSTMGGRSGGALPLGVGQNAFIGNLSVGTLWNHFRMGAFKARQQTFWLKNQASGKGEKRGPFGLIFFVRWYIYILCLKSLHNLHYETNKIINYPHWDNSY